MNSVIFDSFNARFLSPQEVAKTFIIPPQFSNLIGRNHILLVGPRGSGKTSMLKMLQLPAIHAWDTEGSLDLKNKISYTGVFIATDINWKEQISVMHELCFTDHEKNRIEDACMSWHILRALFKSFKEYITYNKLQNDSDFDKKLFQFVDPTANLLNLEVSIRTIEGLSQEVDKKLSQAGAFLSNEGILGEDGRTKRFAEMPFYLNEFIKVVEPIIEYFNHNIAFPDCKWAFCFDELELAPERLRGRLISDLLRSTYQNIIFKLSISLISGAKNYTGIHNLSPSEGDDYGLITLGHTKKNDEFNERFTFNLVQNIIKEKEIDSSVEEIFGVSEVKKQNKSGFYEKGGDGYKNIQKLRDIDSTFKKLYDDKISKIYSTNNKNKADKFAPIRKLYPTILFRLYYKTRNKEARQNLRSINLDKFYSGWDTLVASGEGNPRWIIGITNSMLSKHSYTKSKFPISPTIQAKAYNDLRNRFRAKLKTYKVSPSAKDKGLFKFLEIVGSYFKKLLYDESFPAEPCDCFKINCGPAWISYQDALNAAYNAGAIVYSPESDDENFIGGILEKRFRLCYLLAMEHKLPLRVNKPTTLSNIFNEDSSTQILLDYEP